MHTLDRTGSVYLDSERDMVGAPCDFGFKRSERQRLLTVRSPDRYRMFARRSKVGQSGHIAMNEGAGTLLPDIDDGGRPMDPQGDFVRTADVTECRFGTKRQRSDRSLQKDDAGL